MSPLSTLRALGLGALVGIAACRSATDATPREGRLSGTWGGEPFVGDARAFISGGSLSLQSGSPNNEAMEKVSLGLGIPAPAQPGRYALAAGSAQILYVIGGDGIGAMYDVAADRPGTLIVTEVKDGYVHGSVDFYARAQRGIQPAGAEARFEGEFRAALTLPR